LAAPGKRPAFQVLVGILCLGMVGALSVTRASAADTPSSHDKTFMGQAIVGEAGRYVAAKDVNVRKGPKSKSEKVGTLKRGERVYVSGQAKADKTWIAVLRNAEPLGFVFGEMLLPLIDGALDRWLRGSVSSADGGTCDYIIKFDGKSPVEDDLFEVADYTVKFSCTGDEKALKFSTSLFLTEAPYRMESKPDYQITLDIIEISDGYDQVFSTTSVYNTTKKTVRFDGTSIKDYEGKPKVKTVPAPSVAAALEGAVKIAVSAWSEKVWQALAKQAP